MVNKAASASSLRITFIFVMTLVLGVQGMLFSARSSLAASGAAVQLHELCSGATAPAVSDMGDAEQSDSGHDHAGGLCCLAGCAAGFSAAPPVPDWAIVHRARDHALVAFRSPIEAAPRLAAASGPLGARAPPVAV